ncbi:hypothetical protein [Methylomicrobium sp. Wu6]|uniref:hypothetical protein n=1 Tax=Methylomicrobium sp. Wu6 TaxID=3107928 RepID=UPI002DD63834|nr:hypothetical protein [Methylomicrobium sp. Wu6]MEC4747988.1 hypothetical protein [Methylomicrobium sp. Wu6]
MTDDSMISSRRRRQIEAIILILLLIASLVGIFINDYSPADGYGYWIMTVFVFAFFSIILGWLKSRQSSEDFVSVLREQALHWFCSLLVVGGASLVLKPENNSGLIILLILSLATVLDGLRVGWRFSVVGIFLGISAVIPTYTDHFFWVELVIVAAIITLTIIWSFWLRKNN